jgi:hypothetical protein
MRHVNLTMKETYNHGCIKSNALHYMATSKELGIIQQSHFLEDINQRLAAGPHKPDPLKLSYNTINSLLLALDPTALSPA